LPLASSLRTLLLLERSGVEFPVSPDATAGEGCVSRSTERGDLQREHPIVRLIRKVTAKAARSVETEGLPGHCGSSPFDHLLYPRGEQVLRCRLCFLPLFSRLDWSRLDPSLGAWRPASGSL
jgi:hypothetical protein